MQAGGEHERGLAPDERADAAQGRADGGHRRELVAALDDRQRDEQRHRGGGEHDRERLLDVADAAQVDGRDRADGLLGLLVDVLDDRSVGAGGCATARAVAVGVAGLREDDVGAAGVVCGLEVGQVGDHERVTRGRGELLHDPGDVERHDVEAAGAWSSTRRLSRSPMCSW